MKKVLSIVLLSCIIISTMIFVGLDTISAAPKTMPIISRNVQAFASSDIASSANDSDYGTTWRGTVPGWIAYDLSSVPENQRNDVLVAWYNNDTYDYDSSVLNTGSYNIPSNYTIEGNTSSTSDSAPTSGWVTLKTVTNNVYHSRQHSIDLSGYNWIRMNISSVNSLSGDVSSINLDIHDASEGIQDSWIFYGDSITAGGMVVNGSGSGTFAEIVNSLNSNYFPAAENGGVGSIMSTHGAQNINKWLSTFPGQYVGVAFGTNDAWGNQTGADNYYNNTETIVKAILAANKTPLVSKIPWSTLSDINANIPSYNAKIDDLYLAYPEIIPGPDFETIFKNNTDYLSSDNVHPNNTGYSAMRSAWAEVAINSVYNNNTPTNTAIPTDTSSPPSTATPTDTSTPETTTNTPTSEVPYNISYNMSDWGNGATVNISITNTGTTTINDWTLSFSFPGNQEITNLWCGSYEQEGNNAIIYPESWNNTIPVGETVTIGFNINYTGSNEVPSSFNLN